MNLDDVDRFVIRAWKNELNREKKQRVQTMQYASLLWSSVAYALPEQALHNKIDGAHYRKKGPVSVLGTQSIKSSQHFDKGSSSLLLQTTLSPSNLKSITSTSNSFVKHCVKLRQNSSYRDSHGLTLVMGTTLIREIHEFQMLKQEEPKIIEHLFLLDEGEDLEDIHAIPGDRVYVSSAVMKKLAGVQSIESIEAMALMRIPSSVRNLNDNQLEMHCKRWFPHLHRILVLEGIQDPGNLGTLLRSALAFKWNGVFLLPGCCDPFNEKALRASRGAPFRLPVVSGNWSHLEALRNEAKLKMLAGHPGSSNKTLPVSKLSQELANSLADTPLCLVLGTEGGGLSQKAKELSQLVSIPMSENFESLNVAVAGGIFMFVLVSERA